MEVGILDFPKLNNMKAVNTLIDGVCYKIMSGNFKGKIGMAQHSFPTSAIAPIHELVVFEDDTNDFNSFSFLGKFSTLKEATTRDENYFKRYYYEYLES
jgi:hypothetical protein